MVTQVSKLGGFNMEAKIFDFQIEDKDRGELIAKRTKADALKKDLLLKRHKGLKAFFRLILHTERICSVL